MMKALSVLLVFMLCLPVAYAHEVGQVSKLDTQNLPLGDGKVSNEPRRGYVYACMSSFRGGGARHVGNWIHGSTWDDTQKIHVQGEVTWPDASISISSDGDRRMVSSNALPDDHTTGIFPVRRDDPAFQIDRNPNTIMAQTISLSLPLIPTVAAKSYCVPMGMIGVALDGVPFFNALDDAGRDAVAHEVQDDCNGHPQHGGEYHYHGPSPCMKSMTDNNALIGYALDGFGIYSMYDENGREQTNDDLDEWPRQPHHLGWQTGRDVPLCADTRISIYGRLLQGCGCKCRRHGAYIGQGAPTGQAGSHRTPSTTKRSSGCLFGSIARRVVQFHIATRRHDQRNLPVACRRVSLRAPGTLRERRET